MLSYLERYVKTQPPYTTFTIFLYHEILLKEIYFELQFKLIKATFWTVVIKFVSKSAKLTRAEAEANFTFFRESTKFTSKLFQFRFRAEIDIPLVRA